MQVLERLPAIIFRRCGRPAVVTLLACFETSSETKKSAICNHWLVASVRSSDQASSRPGRPLASLEPVRNPSYVKRCKQARSGDWLVPNLKSLVSVDGRTSYALGRRVTTICHLFLPDRGRPPSNKSCDLTVGCENMPADPYLQH